MYKIYKEWTATNLFIVPLLGIKRASLMENGLHNAYIKDEVKGVEYERGVYMLFRAMNQEKFNDLLLSERKRKAALVDEYDYPDGWTMVVYQYDTKWEEDVKKILKGEFSFTSKSLQDNIPKTSRVMKNGVMTENLTLQHQIFKKAPSLSAYWNEELGLELDYKEDEFWDFYLEKEYFTQETLNNLI